MVVKAQVKVGGRGKAGGVKLAKSPAEAAQAADDILGLKIKGHTVRRVMIAEGADIAEEYYFSILLDRTKRRYLVMLSKEGGVEIETLAVERPEALVRRSFSPLDGMTTTLARDIATEAGFSEEEITKLIPVFKKLYEAYVEEDATLVEVNPLVKTSSGDMVALDGKVSLDENAAFRHPDHAELQDHSAQDPLELKAQKMGLNYVKLDGSVGVIGNGAGLVMSTLDVVAYAGEGLASQPKPANFLDIGGGANAEVMAAAEAGAKQQRGCSGARRPAGSAGSLRQPGWQAAMAASQQGARGRSSAAAGRGGQGLAGTGSRGQQQGQRR